MCYEDKGQIELAECDDANVPVSSFVHEPDEESPKWRWTADNYMPRKGRIEEGSYEIEADTKEAILAAVRKHVVPLYKAALENLETDGSNYYFERNGDDSA